tara:strand:+ start:249 stop:572 length:324 start_codon:yes stop_codon:yes gene_type:complete
MNKLYLTKHAILRLQQRGISTDIVEFIYEHGEKIRDHQSYRYFFTKKALKNISEIKEYEYFIKKNDKQLNKVTLIVDKDVLITAMHNTKRIKKNKNNKRKHLFKRLH